MDIYCPHCGEPWDWHELRELADADADQGDDFALALCGYVESFARFGCGVFGRCSDDIRRGILHTPELNHADYSNEALEWIQLLGYGGKSFDLDAAISGWPRPRDC